MANVSGHFPLAFRKRDPFSCLQELFVQELAKESYTYTVQGKRKTVQRKDMGNWFLMLNIYG